MDKKPERLVPEVRFKGFTDDWEQHKLRKVACINPKTNIPDNFKYVDLESVVGTSLIKAKLTTKQLAPSRAQRVAKKGDIFYQTVRPYQKNTFLFDINNYDFQYVFSTGYAQLRSEINNYFLFSYLQRQRFVNLILRRSTGTSYPAISSKDLSEIKIIFPRNSKEQENIGKIINLIDALITLQQRKLEQLKLLKKAILQIIASNGFLLHTKKVDMIKVRVADIYQITRGNVLARSEISNVQTSKYPYPVYSSQTKNLGLMGYYKDFLFKNAITWTTDGANAGTVKYRKGRFYSTNVNGVLLSSEGLANQLTAELLNLVAFKYVSHVGNPKLMNNTMGEIMFNIPESIETQQYFSNCIELVINLIGKQEKAIDKLNKLKKYLLQELFI